MLTIVGNGKSREGAVLSTFERWWGCNAVYRDATPELLFTIDIPMHREVIESEYYLNNKVAMGEIEPIEIMHLPIMQQSFTNRVITSVKDDDTHILVQGDDEVTTIVGLKYPNEIISYSHPQLKNLFCGMSALGYALINKEPMIRLYGFDALLGDNYSNVYEGSKNYSHKYNIESRVISAQRSQFIALLKEFNNSEVYVQNPLAEIERVEYNKLTYYENSERWILGQGLESEYNAIQC